MEDEDDYDDFGDELEDALDDDDTGKLHLARTPSSLQEMYVLHT